MNTTLEPLTDEAIRRAELADPNSRRCLIENGSTTCAVELVHVFSRETRSRVIKAIEWNWGMRKDSLNLDTRQNVFFLGAAMRDLYKSRRWALLPERSDLDPYLHPQDMAFRIRTRSYIPKIEPEALYKYRLIPIQFMEDVYLTRQSNDDGSVTIHSYPFEDLPMITSHVNPRYAILHLGAMLNDPNTTARKIIMKNYPLLDKIEDIYTSWTHSRSYNDYEPSFLPQPTIPQPGSTYASAADVDRTPLRRIPIIASADEPNNVARRDRLLWEREAPATTSSRPSSPSTSHDPKLFRTSKKRPTPEDNENDDESPRKRLLTYEALKMQKSRKDIASAKWTTTKISVWAQELCVHSPPQPPAPSTSAAKPQPPRRSARLLAKRPRSIFPVRRSARRLALKR